MLRGKLPFLANSTLMQISSSGIVAVLGQVSLNGPLTFFIGSLASSTATSFAHSVTYFDQF